MKTTSSNTTAKAWVSEDGALKGVIKNDTLILTPRSQAILRIVNARLLGIRPK